MKLEITQKTIGAFCDNTGMRPAMTGVRIDKEAGLIVATDGHVVITLPVDCNDMQKSVTLPVVAFPKKKGNYTVIGLAGDTLTIREHKEKYDALEEERITTLDPDMQIYPNWKSVFPPDTWVPELLAPIGFNMEFLAKFGPLAKEVTGSPDCKCTFYGPERCVILEEKGNGRSFKGLCMPTRIL